MLIVLNGSNPNTDLSLHLLALPPCLQLRRSGNVRAQHVRWITSGGALPDMSRVLQSHLLKIQPSLHQKKSLIPPRNRYLIQALIPRAQSSLFIRVSPSLPSITLVLELSSPKAQSDLPLGTSPILPSKSYPTQLLAPKAKSNLLLEVPLIWSGIIQSHQPPLP